MDDCDRGLKPADIRRGMWVNVFVRSTSTPIVNGNPCWVSRAKFNRVHAIDNNGNIREFYGLRFKFEKVVL